jgi:multidrug efflux pump subunit AcrA (membrane-fusion protein)
VTDLSTAKSLFIRRETDVWGSLWFLRAALTEATERLAQRSTEAADLRLLCDELEVEAAATRAEAASARTEAQQRQLELGQVIGERDQSRNQAAEAVGRAEALRGQLAEVSARAGALVEDLVVAVGSAQSAQAAASEQRARAEGMFWPLCDFDSASFFNSCLKNSIWLFAEFESALNESAKALAQAAEQKEADRVAMSEAISAFCQVFGLDDVSSGSSPQSRLRALGGHVRSRLCSIPKIQILKFSQTCSKFKMNFKFHFKMFVCKLISTNKV